MSVLRTNGPLVLMFAQNVGCGYAEAVLTSTHNLCFGAKRRKQLTYLCIAQFRNIKVGFKGVYITQTCYPDRLKQSLNKSILCLFQGK